MRISLALASLVAFAVLLPASAADDSGLARMTLCRDSWVEWTKSDPARFQAFRAQVMKTFSPHGNDPYWLPKTKVSVLGFRVLQAFPDSVGMGVGFSLTVDATFDEARTAMEAALGKKLAHCETGEGTRDCELEIGPQRSVMLMAEDNPKTHRALIGCYYFYEK